MSRGNFYVKVGALMYGCYNCNASMRFETFLKDFDSNLYQQYRLEVFKEGMSNQINIIQPHIPETKKYIPDIFEDLPLVSSLDEKTQAFQFCSRRKLPIYDFDFHFVEGFYEWSKGHTDKFEKWTGKDHSRIVMPWRDENKKIIGYSARALDNLQQNKYIRIFLDDDVKLKLFGMDRVDLKKQVYVLEGEIDSLMISNALAVANGKLHTYVNKDAIYIPDNDVRNKHIMRNVSEMIDMGLKVCLLPENEWGKDLNEMKVNGNLTESALLDIINKNVVQGLSGKLKFNNWKKV